MNIVRKLANSLRLLVVFQLILGMAAPGRVFAHYSPGTPPDERGNVSVPPELDGLPRLRRGPELQTEIFAQEAISPTLELDIRGTPIVPYDFNDTISPEVFVVHAQVVNTGTVAAQNVTLTLDFGDDPETGWALLNDEVEERFKSQLDTNSTFNGYWFAVYPLQVGATHQYTVTLTADDIDPMTAVGTAEVVNALDTGNNYQEASGDEVIVGVTFAITVTYNLGTNHTIASFSPAGNPDFLPGNYRLLRTKTDFYDSGQNLLESFDDQLYFPNLNPTAEYAVIWYEFIALSPTSNRLCPYTMVVRDNTKYDNDFCTDPHILPITGDVSLEMEKTASHETILQGETITYTISYTNNGTLQLQNAWIWDDVDPSFASVLTNTLVPPGDPTWTDDHRAAWYPDIIGAVDDEPPPRNGTVSFAAVVDGGGNDLADGETLVNHGKFGITEGRLPETVALTATAYTTINAPDLILTKTDGQDTVDPGAVYTYTLQVDNVGSEIAENLVVTDTLPMYLSLAGTPQPEGFSLVGDQIIWTGLGSLSAGDPPLEFKIPVQLDILAPDGHVITNTMQVGYANRVGHVYNPAVGIDTTTVSGPVLMITKTPSQDPVLAGDELTYELSYSNAGAGVATGVVISDVIPADTAYQGKCSHTCSYDSLNDVVSWSIGSLSPGASDTVTFTVSVSPLLAPHDTITNAVYGIFADQLGILTGAPVTVTVETDPAIIQGKAFVDENLNGVLDVGEVGIENVEVALLAATTPVTYTDASGDYAFSVDVQQAISLTAGLPAGYFRTTPDTVYLTAYLGVTDTVVNFGYAPITSTWGAAYGTVFEDKNQNGVQDLDEIGIPGVEVASTLAYSTPLTTTGYGQVTFRYDVTSTATITETDPAGHVSTTPNVLQVSVEPGAGQEFNFGDFAGIKISGMVFEDLDVDGENDGEPGLSGVVVNADTLSDTTSVSGSYALYLPVDGSPIEITEQDPEGYVSTNAVPGEDVTKVDANTLRIEVPTAGIEYTGDFGDILSTGVVTITGVVWNDNGEGIAGIKANGLKEPEEPGLPGAVVALSSGMTQTTGADGVFLLYGTPGAVITVTEQNPSGYISTDAIPGFGTGANRVDRDTLVLPALGQGATSGGHLFGDVLIESSAIITGFVFDDADENGVKGAGESGLAGVTVTLEIKDGNTISVLTDSSGAYQFAVAPGTDVKVSTDGPGDGYYPTTSESNFLRPPAPGEYGDNNFGYSDDVDTSAIIGVVFHDLNQNGVRDFGEIGLPGAVISLTLGGSLVDTRTTSGTGVITGTFTFTVPRPAVGVPVVYGLHETNPVGYRSTTPDDLNLVVTSLQTAYQVEFGDSNDPGPAFVYGIVYEDANKNGEQEPTEIGISGVSVSLYDPVLDSTVDKVTNAWGTYSFLVEDPGVYVISETDPDGYLSTTPNEVHVSASLGENYRVDFGDVLRAPEDFAVIHGTVFHDGNGNGVYDLLESGIGGVLITLDGLYTATTDIYGGYTFSTTVAGTHTLVESDLEGYFSTTPNEVHVSAALGGEYRVDFGDGLKGVDEFASIHGTVFHDEDQDGIWDAAEPGIPGVSITLDGSAATTTDVYGSYAFTTTLTGAHTVVETDLPKHISTTPNTVDVVDVLVGEDYLVNFGDKYQEFFFYFPIMGVTSGSP